jgi:4-carboxymuconolactone decarboxylase
MDRATRSEAKYEQLFGPRDAAAHEDDPELMGILRRVIFGEVFFVGDLDDRTRELITVVVLAANQMLPQLKAHTGAALNVGVSSIELREAIYQCAPFMGFPGTLNAIAIVNDVFRDRGIALPLPEQATVAEHERFERGAEIQVPLYGNEITDAFSSADDARRAIPRLLTEFCFGDFYTRLGLDLAQRELLVLCLLAALGDTGAQIEAHSRANAQSGNDTERQIAALIHCMPYIGFPRTLNAIRLVQSH